jgi:hypothetical protein
VIGFIEKKGLAKKQDIKNKRKEKPKTSEKKSKVLEQVQHECSKAHMEL